MPFRNAWAYVLALLVLTFVAFWPSYLSNLPGGKIAWHFHAASAVLWTALAVLQSWSIHHGRRTLHRRLGLSVFLLFPFFLVGGMWAIHAEATSLAEGLRSGAGLADPDNVEIAQFGIFDPLANFGYALLFWGGLRFRQNIQLHARYMLGTVMFVVAPIVWRLLRGYVPGFHDAPFSYPFAAGNLVAIAIALYLYWRAPKHGRPFLMVAAFVSAQEILFETVGRIPAWAPIFARVADANLPLLLVSAALVSLGIARHGWVSGRRPVDPKAA